MKRFMYASFAWLAVLLLWDVALAEVHAGIGEILRKSRESYDGIQDYTCMLHRKDLVGDRLKEHTTVLFKFKKPARYYMHWPGQKIEAIYAAGRYDNKMVIHGGLLYNFVSIAVAPEAALRYNRHTLLEADIGHIIDIMEKNYQMAVADPDALIRFDGEEQLGGRKTWRIKAEFPPNRGYYGHDILLHLDQEHHLPIKITVHGWQQELLEAYYYENLRINTGLGEEDFDVNNASYAFTIGY